MSGRQRGRQVSAPKTQTIAINDDGIEITIKGEPKKPFGRDLFIRGITTLIAAADTYSWEKSYFEGKHDESPTEEFYAAILTAVAQHHMIDMAGVTDEEYTVEQVLSFLIDQLRASGHLQNSAREQADSEDEDS